MIAALSVEVRELVTRLSVHATEIDRLTAEAATLAKDLKTQLTRIAQIQAQLDHLSHRHGASERKPN